MIGPLGRNRECRAKPRQVGHGVVLSSSVSALRWFFLGAFETVRSMMDSPKCGLAPSMPGGRILRASLPMPSVLEENDEISWCFVKLMADLARFSFRMPPLAVPSQSVIAGRVVYSDLSDSGTKGRPQSGEDAHVTPLLNIFFVTLLGRRDQAWVSLLPLLISQPLHWQTGRVCKKQCHRGARHPERHFRKTLSSCLCSPFHSSLPYLLTAL